ncbi:MAG TPA: hypothetical protein VJB06_00220, partial [archaeon]|nr:hypothetical protein [archaeon]
FESLKKLRREKEFKGLWGKYFSENRLAYVITGLFVGFLAAISFNYVLLFALVFSAISMVASLLLTETGTKQKKEFSSHFSDVFKLVWTNKKLFYTIIYFGLLGGFAEATFKFNQAYYQLIGLPLMFFGVFFAISNIAGFLTARYTIQIEKKLGERKSVLILPVFICLSYFGLWIHASLLSLLIFIFEDGLYSFRYTVGAHEINKFTKKRNRSTVVSVYGLTLSLFTAAMSLVFGFMGNYGITSIYLTGGIILAVLIAYPTYYLLKK